MEELQIFKNEEFGTVRTVTDKVNNVWFDGKDVAECLGYSNTKDSILNHVDLEDRHVIQKSENATFEIPNRGLTVINESGLYANKNVRVQQRVLGGACRCSHGR